MASWAISSSREKAIGAEADVLGRWLTSQDGGCQMVVGEQGRLVGVSGDAISGSTSLPIGFPLLARSGDDVRW